MNLTRCHCLNVSDKMYLPLKKISVMQMSNPKIQVTDSLQASAG